MREELFHADGQTKRQAERHDEDTVRFISFANAPKNAGVTQKI
jgi:hypothetical protein